MTKAYRLNTDERSTVLLALAPWAATCKHEAATMDTWSVDETLSDAARTKCRANADASRGFMLDADVLARRIRTAD